jgi:hypothetical protein
MLQARPVYLTTGKENRARKLQGSTGPIFRNRVVDISHML